MDLYIFSEIDLNLTDLPETQFKVRENILYMSYVLIIAPYVMLVFGVPGNLLSIAVLSRRAMKDNIFSVYLISLCSFNIMTMCFNLPRFIVYGETGKEFSFPNDFVCMLYRWLSKTLIVVTNWHLVVITGARLTFILDRKKKVHYYKHNPRSSIFLICLFAILFELPVVVFWIRFVNIESNETVCYLPGTSLWVYPQVLIQGILPALLLILMNSWIFYIHKHRDTGLISSSHTSKMVRQLAVLAFVSSLQFLVTMIPICIVYPGRKRLFDLTTQLGRSRENLAYSLALMFQHFNYSTNFIIYCFFGKRFRVELCRLLLQLLKPCGAKNFEPKEYLSSTSNSEVSRIRTEMSLTSVAKAMDQDKIDSLINQLTPPTDSACKKSNSSDHKSISSYMAALDSNGRGGK
uniref:G-protein coupled receptors family 1 profile domain-containing protein n=1 Tax=Biomphalaria glabrata TaxID=6526 RepID=A0A2C9LYJ1_BIOGL